MIQPRLRFFDLTMIVVSMVIGIGIFRNPSIIAQDAGSETIFFLAWIIGGIVSICGALTFAEIGARMPTAGGYYKTFSYCYHPAFAFMLIWTYIILNAGSTAAVAFTGAQYITPLVLPANLNNAIGNTIMFFSIVTVLFLLNYAGIRMGARTQNILSSFKILLMLVFISAVFFIHPAVSPNTLLTEPATNRSFFLALGSSLIAVFFSYGGYQNTSNLGGDIKQPQKNIPRAIVTAIGIVLVVYLAINFVYVKVLGFSAVKTSPLIAFDLGRAMFGDVGATFASVAIFISVMGFINASLMYNPRVMYALSEEGILPRLFGKVNSKTQTQEFALSFFVLLMIAMFLLLQTYENLLDYVMFTDTLQLALASFCIFILRKKQEQLSYSGFKIRWFPLIPIMFLIVIVAVNINVVINDPLNSLYGFGALLMGWPLYKILKMA